MSHRRLVESLPSLVLAAAAAVYVWLSYGYDAASRAMPSIAGLLVLVLAVLDVAATTGASLPSRERSREKNRDQAGRGHALSVEVTAFGWIGAFLLLVFVLGFYASIPLYVFCYLKLYAKKSSLVSAATAFGVAGFLYGVFGVLMGYEIFAGLLGGDSM